MARFLPYGRQSIDESDIEAVTDVLRSDWLTTGPAVADFETDFAAAVQSRHALACANGTAALHLALSALGVGRGDVCIVPAITFAATANAALYCGADIVFADVDADTGLMTPDHLENALARTPDGRARAILPVHLAGQCEDMARIGAIARAAGAGIVEDACHAVGSRYDEQPVGSCAHSDLSIFSFHPVKTIAAGEGGMVTTQDEALARRVRLLRSHGIERDPAHLEQDGGEPWWYEMQALGWNYRLSDIQAALAHSQLKRLDAFRERRTALAARYDALLAERPHIAPLKRTPDCDPCLHLYPVRIDFDGAGTNRCDVMTRLRERGVGSQVHYIPVPMQPFYRRKYGDQTPPGAAAYYGRTLSLPLYTQMSDEDPDRVVEALEQALGR